MGYQPPLLCVVGLSENGKTDKWVISIDMQTAKMMRNMRTDRVCADTLFSDKPTLHGW